MRLNSSSVVGRLLLDLFRPHLFLQSSVVSDPNTRHSFWLVSALACVSDIYPYFYAISLVDVIAVHRIYPSNLIFTLQNRAVEPLMPEFKHRATLV